MNLVIFLRDFDGILSEFHGYSQKMMKCLEILRKSARKRREKAENSGIGAKFHSFISFFQSYPYEAGSVGGIPPACRNITALSRWCHNVTVSVVAEKLNCNVGNVQNVSA